MLLDPAAHDGAVRRSALEDEPAKVLREIAAAGAVQSCARRMDAHRMGS
jgi:hypothetical protein